MLDRQIPTMRMTLESPTGVVHLAAGPTEVRRTACGSVVSRGWEVCIGTYATKSVTCSVCRDFERPIDLQPAAGDAAEAGTGSPATARAR
ncbi:MAG: hypothetical protein QOE98_2582 [Gaiellaceae bacterium]|jgi:hypothetical protein|nr:hypothetical protein [Gaiellaceae bacterium]